MVAVSSSTAKRANISNDMGIAKKQATDKHVKDAIDEQCINYIRALCADLPQKANSGHPGGPMGCASMAHGLFGHVMNYMSSKPNWINRDRFVLSNGHACALLYTMLHLSGYDLSMHDLKTFRQLNSKTPGHPEVGVTPGIEVTTGPLGQGISNSVGLAIGAHHMAALYNRAGFEIFDNYVYCICGDGCLQEGVSSEACSLAGHLGLGRLIVLYDSNNITIDGNINLSFTENVLDRYKSYGWHVMKVDNGDTDSRAIVEAVLEAKNVIDKPTIIEIKTTIGYGSLKAGTEKVHGAPLGVDDVSQFKAKIGLTPESFQVPDVLKRFYEVVAERNTAKYALWEGMFSKYGEVYPKEYKEIKRVYEHKLRPEVEESLLKFVQSVNDKADSTRSLSGKILKIIKNHMPELIGGSADLTNSNCTNIDEESFHKSKDEKGYANRYIHFGVREHGMCAIVNGLHAYGPFRPFGATFLNFYTYGWGAVRLSALSHFGVLYIATHDSIELGEDGPTHQPIESLPLMRSTPNLHCYRPADANEVAAAYISWLRNSKTPVVLSLSRGSTPPLNGSTVDLALKGAYILSDFENNGKKKVILGGSGTETHLCMESMDRLKLFCDVRIVSFPCWDVFEVQTEVYKQSVMLQKERREGKVLCVYVEASSTFGFDRYFDTYIGMTSFGSSAPKTDLMKHFNFTPEKIESVIRKALNH